MRILIYKLKNQCIFLKNLKLPIKKVKKEVKRNKKTKIFCKKKVTNLKLNKIQ